MDEQSGIKKSIFRRFFLPGDFFKVSWIALAYFFAHHIAFFFPDSEQVIMLVWPAGGVGLAAFLLNPKRLWPALTVAFYLAGILADSFIGGRSWMTGFGYMTANMVESIGCAWLILHGGEPFQKFKRIREVLALIVGTVFVNGFSSCIGAGTSVMTRGAFFADSWLSWFISDGLGVLLIGPFIVTWADVKGGIAKIRLKQIVEGLICLGIWFIMNWLIFYSNNYLFSLHVYILVALLAWPALRFGQRGVTLALVLLFLMSIESPAIINGPSPWAGQEENLSRRLLELQIFLGFMSIIGYLLASAYESLQNQLEENKRSEQKFRNFADYTHDWEFWLAPEGGLLYISPSCERISGYKAEEFMENPRLLFEIVHPEDSVKFAEHFKQGPSSASSSLNFRIIRKDGKICWIGHVCQPALNEDGVFLGERGSNKDITSQLETEEMLKQTRIHLIQTLDATTEGVWEFRSKTGETFFSPKYYTMLGYEPYQFAESLDIWKSLIHPEDRDSVVSAFSLFEKSCKGSFHQVYRMKSREGKYIWIEARAKIMERDSSGEPLLMIGSHTDITNNKEYEIKLLEMTEQFSQIANSIPDAFLLYDFKTESLIYSNQAFEKMKPERAVNSITLRKLIQDFIDPTDRSKADDLIDQIRQGQILEFNQEFQTRRYDGSRGWIRVQASIVRKSIGQEQRMAMIISDISSFKEAAEKERLHRDQLVQADKMISLGLLVSGVAHEINNPNNYIMLNIPLLRKVWETVLPVLKEYCREKEDFKIKHMSFLEFSENVIPLMDGIAEGSKKIQNIVADLKNYARMDQPRAFLEVDLNRVVQSAVNLIFVYIRKACSRFSCVLLEEPLIIKGSFQKMEQVAVNLIQNAVDSLTDPGQKIQVETFKDTANGKAGIRISDEGKGIAPEDLSRITDPFFTTKRDSGGTGLGLSITHGIIKDHEGELIFNSTPGKGTVVTILLPLEGRE